MERRVGRPTTLGAVLDELRGDTVVRHCSGCERDREFDAFVVRQVEHRGLTAICPECAASDPGGQRAMAAAARESAQKLAAARKAAGIPSKWAGLTLADLDPDEDRIEAIGAAAEWALGRRRRGLLFYGEVGRGKTAIAAAAANGRVARAQPVRWLPVGELLMDLRMPFESEEYIRAQRTLDPRGAALVLDDLDKVRPSEFAREPIYVAVNAWVEAELPLLVTMNRDLDALSKDFGERYGEPVASRLAGYCDQFEVAGRDRRVD